MQRVNVVKIF